MFIRRTVALLALPALPSVSYSLTTSASASRTIFRASSSSSSSSSSSLASTPSSTMSSSSTGLGRVSLLQFHVTHSKEANIITAQKYIKKAACQSPNLIVLPEIWNSPYSTGSFRSYSEPCPCVGDTISSFDCSNSPSVDMLFSAAADSKTAIIGGSIPEIHEDKIYNTCLVIDGSDGRGVVIGKHRKIHLFDIDVKGGITFKESDTLTAGSTPTAFDLPVLGTAGVAICYDVRFPELSLLMASKMGCKILVYPGAFNMTTGPKHWELLMRARANDCQAYVLAASPARATEKMLQADEEEGRGKGYVAWGHSMAVSPWGEVLGSLNEGEDILTVDIDLNLVDEVRGGIPVWKGQRREDVYKLEALK